MRQRIPPSSRNFAKSLRTNSTDAERRLWSLLRGSRLGAHKFKRQVPIDGYIVDFVCFEARLIIELDGGQHAGSTSDQLRDAHFRAAGFRTVRFWNIDVLDNIEGIYARLVGILSETGR
jgi:very-short-patch-repair endonuclease